MRRCPHCGTINEQKYRVGEKLIAFPDGETVEVVRVKRPINNRYAYQVKVVEYGIKPNGVSGVMIHPGQYKNVVEQDLVPVDEFVEIMRQEGFEHDPLALKKGIAIEVEKLTNRQGKKGKTFRGFRGGRTGPFRAELTKPTYRKDEQLGFGIHVAKDEQFARLYAEDDRTARKGSEPIVEPTEVVMKNPLESRVVVTEGDALWDLVKKLVPKNYRFYTEGGKPVVFLQNAIDAASPQKAERVLKEAGYDGVIYDATVRGGINPMSNAAEVSGKSESYVVFDPSQVRTGEAIRGQLRSSERRAEETARGLQAYETAKRNLAQDPDYYSR